MVVSAREVKGARVIGSVARLGQRDVLLSFFFNDTATTEIYTLSLHDALPICLAYLGKVWDKVGGGNAAFSADGGLDGSFQDRKGAGRGKRADLGGGRIIKRRASCRERVKI